MTIEQIFDVTFEIWGALFCVMAAISTMVPGRKDEASRKLVQMELINAMLLICDTFAWIFRGNVSTLGYYMVRISNYLVFVLNYCLLVGLTYYVMSFIDKDRQLLRIMKILIHAIALVGIALVTVNAFTGYFYYFDATNHYTRGPGFAITQVWGYMGIVINVILMVHYREHFSKRRLVSFLAFLVLPLISVILQTLHYGISLNNMAYTIAVLMAFVVNQVEKGEVLMKQQEELNDMQLKVVLSQIQPHFLYNSLNAIYFIAGKDAKKAQEAISQFSDYLRGNLDSLKKTEPVHFEEELNHVTNYLNLELLRFEDELAVEYDIQVEDFVLPALSLQPLVENAVKYGVGKSEDGGTVTISTRETDREYIVEVKDDGIGFDMTKAPNDTSRSHIGIQNVRDRVRRMVDGDLVLESAPGQGTVATIYIPKMG